jgi:hypothetical protein
VELLAHRPEHVVRRQHVMEPLEEAAEQHGLHVNQPIAADGIASRTSGTVTTHGTLVQMLLGVMIHALRPWNVMKNIRKVYSAVTNTPASTQK